ncbi:pyrroloquinoline quinone biosynthesis protein PqqB [Halarcobacter mediterraneus]|uniref:Coenzyme PQQ synthesis protein B n=1 Tax=Halarcobacter mediterraneus TaxID=2023153 RepID=A0A4Q1AZG0_9BACT|nr:pyrroloquinoline quinone biosynthesis protein PqqB [Halarcobacter mediterraneus]RXK13179.1 pyrroloquinoline quinone biosynthesis protein PqqB [Halarcobacter mediterraneus]
MRIEILGSSAGGGLPQFNCNCNNCKGYREGKKSIKRRTQSSITISEDGENWVLFNTSPDILEQIHNSSFLHPTKPRETKIKAIIFIDAQIDHTTGLLMLREGCPHEVYCTKEVNEELNTSFPLFKMLEHWDGGGTIYNEIIPNSKSFELPIMPNHEFYALPLISNAPPYSKYRDKPRSGDNIGIVVKNKLTGKKLFYLPGLGVLEKHIIKEMSQADILLVDGTLWTNDEMIKNGFSQKLGTDMGHIPLSGEHGLIKILDTLDKPRKILIHINNTNPILDETSKEYTELISHDIEISYDGMSIEI